MGAKPIPESPDTRADDAAPTTTASGACCWCEDYPREVSTNARQDYYRRFYGGAAASGRAPVKFRLIAALSTLEIKVEIRFHFVNVSASLEQLPECEELTRAGANRWNNQLKIRVEDPECGTKDLKVVFMVVNSASSPHYTIKLHNPIPPTQTDKGDTVLGRAYVVGDVMHVGIDTKEWTFFHEYGHCFGLPDEYGYSDDFTEQVVYLRPDGTQDPAIGVDRPAQRTSMSTHGIYTVRARHGYGIAIELQKLLREKLGRTVRCTVVKPTT